MARDPSLANESSATRMRAVLFDSYGEPDQLYEDSTSVPGRLPGSVVIRVRAAGVNPIDARLREGEGRWILPGRFPRIPGYDVAGEVVDGDRSAKLRKGDRVMAFLTNPYGGGYAQFARCAIDGVARIPDWLSFEEAAATPLAATTALQGLRDHGALKPGDRVLINGASGGVGVFAIQIAKAYGAHVTAVASGSNERFVRSLGADSFINYEATSFESLHRSWQIIFDVAGTHCFLSIKHLLGKHGRFVSTEPDMTNFASRFLTAFSNKHSSVVIAKPKRKDMAELVRLLRRGQLRPHVEDVSPLNEASEVHRQLEAGGHRGKYVLQVN